MNSWTNSVLDEPAPKKFKYSTPFKKHEYIWLLNVSRQICTFVSRTVWSFISSFVRWCVMIALYMYKSHKAVTIKEG